MDSAILIKSLGIGAALFAGFVLFWFIKKDLKRRMTANQAAQLPAASQKTSWEEKRRHPRVAVSWTASMETSREHIEVQLKDISQGGAFVVCRQPLSLDEIFRLTISAPKQEPFTLNAEVVWSNANVSDDKIINRGMGVRFIRNTDTARRRLKAAITSHLGDGPPSAA
jgi:Tfp pilus assembly protein PilZ